MRPQLFSKVSTVFALWCHHQGVDKRVLILRNKERNEKVGNGNGNDLFLKVVLASFQLESYWCRHDERGPKPTGTE